MSTAHAQPHASAPDAHAHHGHVIVSQRTLLTVLSILLFFTLLTVGAAQAEQWISHRYHVEIPQWVNVAVALSIATVKSIIVAAFFMQLKYDNPMNSAIAVFSIMVLSLFLLFTMIDLGGRDTIYAYKAKHIITGGTGGVPLSESGGSINGPVALDARKRADEKIAELEAAGKPLPAYLEHYKEAKEHGTLGQGHAEEGHGAAGSSAAMSRPKKGLTLPELGAGAPAHGGHGAKPEGADKPADAPKPAEPAKSGH